MITYFLLYLSPTWAPLLLRVVVGWLLLVHGWQKVGAGFAGFAGWLGSFGFKFPSAWATLVVVVELIGGVLLVAGLLTHIVAVVVAIEFLVIVLYIKRASALTGARGRELDLLILVIVLSLLCTGPGAYSLDQMLGLLFF